MVRCMLSLGIIVSLFGGGLTLRCILSLTDQDIENQRTAEYLDSGGVKDKKKQRNEVWIGFIITAIGSLMQIIGTWL